MLKNLQMKDLKKVSSRAGGFFLLAIFFELALSVIINRVNTYYFPINPTLSSIFIRFFSFIVPYMIMLKSLGKTPSDVMSIKKPQKHLISYIIIGILVSNIASLVTDFTTNFLKDHNVVSQTPKEIFNYDNTPLGILLFLISLSVVPAITEEFVFRGVIFGSLRKFGDRFAVFASALFFALMHGNIEQIVFAFLLGLYLGYTVIKTNSIILSVLIHFLNNLISGIIIVFKLEDFFTIFYIVIFFISIICFINIYDDKKSNIRKIKRRESSLNFRNKMSGFILNPGMILFFLYVGFSIFISLKH